MLYELRLLLNTLLLLTLAGCASDKPEQDNLTGSDTDEHGCIGSAGYSWCERTNQCERPWEIAEQESFENTTDAFREYCGQLLQ